MSPQGAIDWSTFLQELRRRWLLLVIVGSYILMGGLFAGLIYGLGWDQPATRWAAQVFPLPAARVNGEMIWLSTYYRRLAIFEHYGNRLIAEQPELLPEDATELRQQTLDQLIEMVLLREEARKAGITVSSDEIMQSYDQIVSSKGGKENFEKVLADLYNLTPPEFANEFIPRQLYKDKLEQQLFTKIHVRHIVVKDEAQARQILDKAKNGENFEELAKNFSQDLNSRDQGGDLGLVQRGQLAKSFEDAIFVLPAGQVGPDLIKSDFGWHIVRIDERQDGTISDKSFTEWFDELKKTAKISRYVPKEPTAPASTPSPEPTPPVSETTTPAPSTS